MKITLAWMKDQLLPGGLEENQKAGLRLSSGNSFFDVHRGNPTVVRVSLTNKRPQRVLT